MCPKHRVATHRRAFQAGRELLDSAIDRWSAAGSALVIASHDRAWLNDHADALLDLTEAEAVTG